jgi:hypothetical protein
MDVSVQDLMVVWVSWGSNFGNSWVSIVDWMGNWVSISTGDWVSVGSGDWSVVSSGDWSMISWGNDLSNWSVVDWSNYFSDWGGNDGFSDQRFFVDNSVESVDWISGVFYNTTATVSFDERV